MATTQQELKILKNDIAEIKNILADHANRSASNGVSKMVMQKQNLEQLAQDAGERVRDFVQQEQEQFDQVKAQAETAIKDRPFTTAAVAFASGALLGTLLRRK